MTPPVKLQPVKHLLLQVFSQSRLKTHYNAETALSYKMVSVYLKLVCMVVLFCNVTAPKFKFKAGFLAAEFMYLHK